MSLKSSPKTKAFSEDANRTIKSLPWLLKVNYLNSDYKYNYGRAIVCHKSNLKVTLIEIFFAI